MEMSSPTEQQNFENELLKILEFAVARIEIANAEGDPILSAWLPDAKSAIDKIKAKS